MSEMFAGNRVVAHTGSEYPIIQAPMTWIARAQLSAAVSAAGGLGVMETSSVDVEVTSREYQAIKAATDRPFGVNLPILFLRQNEEMERTIISWIIEHGVRFVTTSAGNPRRHVQQLKDAGVIVYHAVPTLDAALKAEDAGVDGLIVEGAESGGIRNAEEVNSFVLLQAVRERVSLPIVAAGGIVDGRGMAAAMALGADGVTMGTRFVASLESPVHQNYKDAIVEASVDGTFLLPRPPRAKFRTLKTRAAMEMAEALANPQSDNSPGRLSNVIDGLYIGGDVENTMGTAGQSSALVHEIKPVQQIIDETVAGFWREIDRLAAMRPANRG
ncbi:MAG: nitronate monooxygenase [Gammaproteobacteria bacterium]|nr:nitronate monooxygenase [Gammaproteobacteria bacterium]